MGACNVERSVLIFIFAAYCVECVAAQRTGLNCNFDNNLCRWRNVFQNQNLDDFNWKRGDGADGRQKGSGGVGGHNGGGGYMYIKSNNKKNRTALLQSPIVRTQGQSCFQFWYLMKGRTLGHLEVLMSTKSTNKIAIWNLRGHQGNKWLNAKVPVTMTDPATFWFEAFDWEGGKSGNILLDQVSMTTISTGQCAITPSYAVVGTSTQAVTTQQQTTAYMITSSFSKVDAVGTTANSTTTTPAISVVTRSTVTTEIAENITIPFTTPTHSTDNSTLSTTDNITISTPSQVGVQKPSHLNKTWIAIGVLAVIACLVVALLLYFRRKKKQQMSYVDESSVVMMRMYPDITSEPRVEYSKLT